MTETRRKAGRKSNVVDIEKARRATQDEGARDGSADGDSQAWPDLVSVYEALSNEREWRVKGAIEGNPLILLCGREKAGKSWLLMQLCVAAVMGGKWLGSFECVAKGRVLYCDQEYGPNEFCRRIARISRAMGADPRAVLRKILYVNDPTLLLCGGLIRTKEGRAQQKAKPFVRLIKRLLDESESEADLALVVLDPLRNLLDGSENDADVAISAGIALDYIRKVSSAPVIVAHHLNKQGGYSGSRGLMGRFDLLIEGTDEEQPWYSTRGRTLRNGDAITKRFTVEVRHENDNDDIKAATHLNARFEGDGHAAGLSKPAKKLLSELQRRAEPTSVRQLRSTKMSHAVATRALEELESEGLAERDDSGKWNVALSGFFADSEGE